MFNKDKAVNLGENVYCDTPHLPKAIQHLNSVEPNFS